MLPSPVRTIWRHATIEHTKLPVVIHWSDFRRYYLRHLGCRLPHWGREEPSAVHIDVNAWGGRSVLVLIRLASSKLTEGRTRARKDRAPPSCGLRRQNTSNSGAEPKVLRKAAGSQPSHLSARCHDGIGSRCDANAIQSPRLADASGQPQAPGILTFSSFTEFRNTRTSGPRWRKAACMGPIQPISAAVMPSTCTTPTPTHRFS